MSKPTVNLEWATDELSLKSPATPDLRRYGWSTSNNKNSGNPTRPPLDFQNGWNYAVYKWMDYLDTTYSKLTQDVTSTNFYVKVRDVVGGYGSKALGQVQSICYSEDLDLFLAVNLSQPTDGFSLSKDGKTWEDVDSASTSDCTLNDAVWSSKDKQFVAVGSAGTTGKIQTSPDGRNWTVQTNPGNVDWEAITYSESLGIYVVLSRTNGTNSTATSEDGITWVLNNSGFRGESVIWVEEHGYFHAVGTQGGSAYFRSSDGKSWESKTLTSGMYDITYSPELDLLVAVGTSSGSTSKKRAAYSSNQGNTWRVISVELNNYYGVDWSPTLGCFVCCGYGDSGSFNYLYSLDGEDWYFIVDRGQLTSPNCVLWSEKTKNFIFGGEGGGVAKTAYTR